MDADFLLVRRMKQGNEEAFDTFVCKYYGEILNYCRFHCFDAESAQDLTQETFLKFFVHLPEYRHMGLASAALSEIYRRTQPLGATHMTGGGNEFYTRIGFVPTIPFAFWTKDLRQPKD